MIFSVFDHHARRFDYYEAPGTSANYGARGTKYRALSQGPQGPASTSVAGLGGGRPGERVCVGFAPEALAMALPAGARHVGSGAEARGIIATRGGLGGLGAYAGRSAEECGSIEGLGGLGEVPPPPGTHEHVVPATPFIQIVTAACIAAVVGVLVQRVMK